MPPTLLDSELFKIGAAICSGVGVAILYDWLTANRTYVTVSECVKNQTSCPEMVEIKKDFISYKAITNQRMLQLDAQMAEGHANFKEISENISSIKTNLAVLASWVEREHK